jgi:cytoskeleton protein RodZ
MTTATESTDTAAAGSEAAAEGFVLGRGDSPGPALGSARRARKLAIVRIASELRLSPETIEALERDDYDRLPSPVFVAGYIRSYARLLGLDPAPLIARFHALHPGAEPPPRSVPRMARSGQTTRPRRNASAAIGFVAVVVAAVGIGGYLWLRAGGSDIPEGAEPARDEAPAPLATLEGSAEQPAADAPVTGSADDGDSFSSGGAGLDEAVQPSVSTETTRSGELPLPAAPGAESQTLDLAIGSREPSWPPEAPAEAGGADLPDTNEEASTDAQDWPRAEADRGPAPADAESAEPAADVEPAAGPSEVVLAFTGPCWVDIRDATGEVLLFGEKGDGDRHVLDGPAPYSLVIGNAAALRMTVGGEPFDVNAIAVGNVARFDLDPDETAAGPADDSEAD